MCFSKHEVNLLNQYLMIIKNNFYIITGGPGVGKTTLINELQKCNYRCVAEVAREIIKNQTSEGGSALPWKDTKAYSDIMLAHSVRDFINLSGSNELYFFDRGIPDTYGYEVLMNFDENLKLMDAIKEYRYNKTVFILPPWKEIYETDSERKQDFGTAIETYEVMKTCYLKSSYQLIEVPRLPVCERIRFILCSIFNLPDLT